MAVNGIVGANYLLTRLGNPYSKEDCIHAVVINLIRNCPGGDKSYRTSGCTELWNSINSSSKYRHCTKRMTLTEARKEGLLIGDLPVIYNDSTGKCDHIAYYMGGIGGYECIHSSASRGKVCGTTLANGFTHVIRHRDIEGCPVSQGSGDASTESGGNKEAMYSAIVSTETGPLNMRAEPKMSSKVLTQIPKGATVKVLEETSVSWAKIEYGGREGYASRTYLMRTTPVEMPSAGGDSGDDGENYGVYIKCGSREDAMTLHDAIMNAVVSVGHESID